MKSIAGSQLGICASYWVSSSIAVAPFLDLNADFNPFADTDTRFEQFSMNLQSLGPLIIVLKYQVSFEQRRVPFEQRRALRKKPTPIFFKNWTQTQSKMRSLVGLQQLLLFVLQVEVSQSFSFSTMKMVSTDSANLHAMTSRRKMLLIGGSLSLVPSIANAELSQISSIQGPVQDFVSPGHWIGQVCPFYTIHLQPEIR